METNKQIKTAFGRLALQRAPKPGEPPAIHESMRCWCCGSSSTELQYVPTFHVFRCICGVEFLIQETPSRLRSGAHASCKLNELRSRPSLFRETMN